MKDGKRIGVGRVSDSNVITVPAAASPSAINIEKIGFSTTGTSYEIDEAIAGNYVFLDNGNAQLIAEADVDYFGALQFTWKKDGSAIENNPAF
jgi:hypothetical protein